MVDASSTKTNRLIHEKSPYLLQHAHNPVDWYPWGDAAFEKARREDKPILVSIGYSTCHWCHVMEHESFEKEDVAQLMNEHLVCIKVDREERPDVDKIYMTAVSALTGQGGWPLNAFLTSDLKPFYGGTYFPPDARWGHPAWKDVVRHIGLAWKVPDERQKMVDAAANITASLQKYIASSSSPQKLDVAWLDQGAEALAEGYDAERGGFGPAPKFPMPVYHHFLMRYWARTKKQRFLDMSLETLRMMAQGGIYDHLGGGFSRYSTDANWHVPHFEKMLYDNAQLAVNYVEAYQISKDPLFQRVARETLDYVARDLTSPDGGFYSAEDADSFPTKEAKEKKEGAFYVWEKREIVTLLGTSLGERFAARYGVREGGNAANDPHSEFTGKNILFDALPSEEVDADLDKAKKILFDARSKRPRPHLDDKIISAWNGLMLSAFAKGYQVFAEPAYLKKAQDAALFLHKHLYDGQKKILYRRWREGHRQALGIADDYAFVVQGLLDLYESDFNPEWISFAAELNSVMLERFYDTHKGGFFMTAVDQDANLLLRFKEDQDNVEPSASSIAVLNLLRLAQFENTDTHKNKAVRTLEAFGTTLSQSPRAMPAMLSALDYSETPPRQVVLAGDPAQEDFQKLLKVVHERFLPVKVLVHSSLLVFAGMKPIRGNPTAYVCEHFVCKEPTTDPAVLAQQLKP